MLGRKLHYIAMIQLIQVSHAAGPHDAQEMASNVQQEEPANISHIARPEGDPDYSQMPSHQEERSMPHEKLDQFADVVSVQYLNAEEVPVSSHVVNYFSPEQSRSWRHVNADRMKVEKAVVHKWINCDPHLYATFQASDNNCSNVSREAYLMSQVERAIVPTKDMKKVQRDIVTSKALRHVKDNK